MGNLIKIIIADDHGLVRRSIKHIFDRVSDMKVVAEARNAEEVFQKVDSTNADVMVLDLSMPGQDGLEILERLRRTKRRLAVVVFSFFAPEKVKARAVALGASAFLPKDCNPNDLIKAVRTAKAQPA